MNDREIKAVKDALIQRIASNKDWLSKNWYLDKNARRSCQANIEADERALAKLYALDPGSALVDLQAETEEEAMPEVTIAAPPSNTANGTTMPGELQTDAAIAVIRGILERLPDDAARRTVIARVLDNDDQRGR
jgi:hypothetical protein